MTLTEFLLARIAEDEAEVGPFPPYTGARDDSHAGPNGIGWGDVGGISEVLLISHRRVLAECGVKRAILDEFERERQRKDIYNRDFESAPEVLNDNDRRMRLSANARWAGLETAVRLLAQPYADHPDFNSEWRV